MPVNIIGMVVCLSGITTHTGVKIWNANSELMSNVYNGIKKLYGTFWHIYTCTIDYQRLHAVAISIIIGWLIKMSYDHSIHKLERLGLTVIIPSTNNFIGLKKERK